MTFHDWLKTYHGKQCAVYPITGGHEYLENRLWWAFEAGKAAQRDDAKDPAWRSPVSTSKSTGDECSK